MFDISLPHKNLKERLLIDNTPRLIMELSDKKNFDNLLIGFSNDQFQEHSEYCI